MTYSQLALFQFPLTEKLKEPDGELNSTVSLQQISCGGWQKYSDKEGTSTTNAAFWVNQSHDTHYKLYIAWHLYKWWQYGWGFRKIYEKYSSTFELKTRLLFIFQTVNDVSMLLPKRLHNDMTNSWLQQIYFALFACLVLFNVVTLHCLTLNYST